MTEFIAPGTRSFDLPSPFAMKRGGRLTGARLAYETWGTLAPARDNAILIHTGLSPSAHAASNPGNPEPGWWEAMIGPGKAIDTRRWFVICANALGSCKGSTGPASIHPDTGEPWRLDFPELSLEDVAAASHALVESLGIERLACLIGCSLGGMSSLSYLQQFPDSADAYINISGATRALPFSIAIRSLQREAIRLDPAWNQGRYSEESYPESGMRMARKLGVVTYRSALEWDGRFGRVRLDPDRREEDPFGLEFEVESYLEGHARRFIRQYDPNCYLYLSRAMDWFDLSEPTGGNAMAALAALRVPRARILGVTTDILFPINQQEEIAEGLRLGGSQAQCLAFPSPQGHDAVLVDFARFSPAVAEFLATIPPRA